MARIMKNLVEIAGIADYLPTAPVCFKQYDFSVQLQLPEAKPDVREIIKVVAEIVLTGTRVVRTPVATSLEGQTLTGFKLIVEGELRQKIEYAAATASQALYAIHQSTPFGAYIILPRTFIPGTPVSVTAYLEDICLDLIHSRCIHETLSILLDAVL